MSSCHRNFSLQAKVIYFIRRNQSMYKLAIIVALSALASKIFNSSWLVSMSGGIALYLLTGGWRFIRLFYLTIGRDLTFAKIILKIELQGRKLIKSKKIIADMFTENVNKYPNRCAFESLDTGKKLTFMQAEELSNKIANLFFEAGYRKGDVVGLVMENCVEYAPIWIGLSKIGVVTSLLNYNLRGDSLRHCILTAECRSVIYNEDMEIFLNEISSQLDIDYYYYGKNTSTIKGYKNVSFMLQSVSVIAPPRPADLCVNDKMLYIYTSGTTGLPKAALVRGTRFLFMGYGLGACIKATADDKAYNTLPLYHSNGGIATLGLTLFMGSTMVMRKKFSASKFFEDCFKSNATCFNYIGETCRYLLATKTSQYESGHKLRFAFGNGLRPSIWTQFTTRFSIPNIGEFYGATEGNASMVNTTNKVGAVGFNSVLVPWIYPIKLVKIDKKTGDIIRGPDGLAVFAQTGEIGELCGKIKKDVLHKFDGYLNKEATNKKIAYDVFKKGDSVFMTGDVLLQDELGFYYFQDRLGDTFRWKGENVSTNEVEGIIAKVLQMSEVCVYGVEIPGTDGKAGMAAITDPRRQVNISDLPQILNASLPIYAKPVFIRLTDQIEKTSTFKFKKVVLCEAGYSPSKCKSGDELYYFNGKEKNYQILDAQIYQDILNCKIRF